MRTKIGIVGSTSMTGTVSVTVDRFVLHPKYNKRFRRSKKYLADTNDLAINLGDKVEITECRPISKNKYFKVTNVLQSAHQVSDVAEKDISALKREKTTVKMDETPKKEVSKETAEESTTESTPN
jgi:small subunit ribosomal protein S17